MSHWSPVRNANEHSVLHNWDCFLSFLQNNNNLDLCYHLLAQESNRYLYGEFHPSQEEGQLSQNHMLHNSLGYTGSEAEKAKGAAAGIGRSLVHSTSDSHIEPQRPSYPEPLSAPATMAPSPSYNPFFMNDQNRSASTPTPPPTMQGISPTYSPIPRYTMNPITVTLSQSIPNVPQALQIPPGHYVNSTNTTLYIRPSPSQSPQPSPWSSSGAPVYQHQQSPYSTPTFGSPYSSPQHQVQAPQPQHQQYVFLPISSPTLPSMPYHHQQQTLQQPTVYRPYHPKGPLKNQIEITLDGSRPRSSSPVHTPHPQGTLYIANSPSPSSPSRAIAVSGPGGAPFHPGIYLSRPGPVRPRPASSPQPGQSAYTFKPPSSPPVAEAESLLNIDQGAHSSAPAPILPISALPGNIASQLQHLPRRSSSGSDDYAYTQGEVFLTFLSVRTYLLFISVFCIPLQLSCSTSEPGWNGWWKSCWWRGRSWTIWRLTWIIWNTTPFKGAFAVSIPPVLYPQ